MNSTIQSFFEFEAAGTTKTSSLENKKDTLWALQKRRDELAAEIGYRVQDTISSYPLWIMDQIDFNDPRLSDIKGKFFKTEEKISELTWEVDRLEATRDGELPRHEAKVKVYDFLGKMTDENVINFLQNYHLTTITLTEAVLINPKLLEDMTNFEENLEIIRSNPEVWW